MLVEVILLQLLLATVPASVIFEDCGSAYDLLTVNIEGCGMRLPCHVTLGENVPVSVQFHADFVSRQLDQNVVININLVNVDTEVTPEPCAIVHCPLRTNALTSFTSVMSVPTRMALNQRGYLRWRVYNESGRLVLCYSVLVQTQSTLQKRLRQALATITPDLDADNIINSLFASDHQSPNITNTIATEGFLQQLIDLYYTTKREIDDSNDNGDLRTHI